jgi:hypothetical protein
MITLTSAIPISASVLGAAGVPKYDKAVFTSILYEPKTGRISGTLEITSTVDQYCTVLRGTFEVNGANITLNVPALQLQASATLSEAQQNTVRTYVNDAQQKAESAFINLGLVSGLFSTGV